MSKAIRVLPVVAAFAIAGTSQAALLGLDLLDTPDIFSNFTDVTYDSTLNMFDVNGESLTYDDDGIGAAETILNGSYGISASVNELGIASGGVFTLGGNIPSLGVLGPTLLTGSLVDFGFEDPPGGMLFEFIFSVTGGDLAGDYGGAGALFGVVLDINSGAFDGTWLTDFASTGGAGVSDVKPLVPAPGALGLLALAPLAVGRRRRNHC